MIWISPVPSWGAATNPPNVLFLVVDDLNHWIGPLRRNLQVKTPHLDQLAARGVTFTHAYCAAPICNPSRAALLSGLRPGHTGVYGNGADWRNRITPAQTLPSWFRAHGYWAGGAGKIYHEAFPRDSDFDAYGRELKAATHGRLVSDRAGPVSWARIPGGDEVGPDKPTADWVIKQLKSPHERPFFLAGGIYRPHLPWNVPERFFELYPLDSIQLPPVRDDDLKDLPPAAINVAQPRFHEAVLKSGKWKEAVRAYMAAISYADFEVGRILAALEDSRYRSNTIVVLWGDHGWHLGEKQHWRKLTLWEEGTRAPLIWVAPGVTSPGGICERTVDFMGVYPTLCELAGLPIPDHVQGTSFRRLLADPRAEWDRPAITTLGPNSHAIRSERWRYIRYADGSEELYDEQADPYEWTNLAGRPEHVSLKQELARWFPNENAQRGGGEDPGEEPDEVESVARPKPRKTAKD